MESIFYHTVTAKKKGPTRRAWSTPTRPETSETLLTVARSSGSCALCSDAALLKPGCTGRHRAAAKSTFLWIFQPFRPDHPCA
jgi:hypothetical protein